MKKLIMQVKLCSKMSTRFTTLNFQKMKRFLGITFFMLSTQISNAQSFNSNLATLLQDSLTNMVAAFTNTKGMQVSVYLPGQGVWTGSAGLSYAGNPITNDMILGLASNSKLYTAVTMLKLQESGVLDLDDPISMYLAPIANVNPAITIRQLLNHTSGVSDPFFSTALLDTLDAHHTQVYTPVMVLAWLGAPAFAPGMGYQYSNINYILTGMVAESATGFHISQLIRDNILDPLQLDSTFYDIEEPITGNLAHRWMAGADLHDTSRVSLNTAGGCAGSMFATTSEVVQWYNTLMSGQVIDQSSLTEMTNFLMPGNYGLGIQTQSIFGHTYWGHSGGTYGYRSKVMYDPCMQAAICGVANNSEAAEQGITALLMKIIWDVVPGCPGAITGTPVVCPGTTSITYSVPPISLATSYVWTLPNGIVGVSATNIITVDFTMAATSGDITVCGMNNYGVGVTTSYPVIVNAVATNVTESGDTMVTLNTSADTYQWVDCSLAYQPIVGATNQTFEPTNIGSYAVIVTNNGCIDTSACSTINFSGTENYLAETISIYPNPSNGVFRINAKNIAEGSIHIYNSLGQQIYQTNKLLDEINLSNQSKGTYYLRLFTDTKIYSQKIILQ